MNTEAAAIFQPQYRAPKLIDWQKVQADLSPIHCDIRPAAIRRLSRDYFWLSPILREQLDGKVADLIVAPQSDEELLQLANYCVENNIPVTPRGGGTGNYGQAVPEHGGIILDLTRMTGSTVPSPGVVRVKAGTRLLDLERKTLESGWELRFHPSTWKTATVGGFVAGGTSGCGSINFGTLHEPGNILACRVLVFRDRPEFIELRGQEAQKVVHAYGTTGIITEVELALAPALPWRDAIVRFKCTRSAVEFGEAAARAEGLVKKQLTIVAWGQAKYLPIEPVLVEGCAYAPVIIAAHSWEPFCEIVDRFGGEIVHQCVTGDKVDGIAKVDELGFGHTHLYPLAKHPDLVHLTPTIAGQDGWDSLMHMIAHHDEDIPIHVEYLRGHGEMQLHAGLLMTYSTPEALDALCQQYANRGVTFYSPHTPRVETGGMQAINPELFVFKQYADPFGLLNPGKTPGWSLPEGGYFLRS